MSLKRSSQRRKQLLDKLYTKQHGKCHWCAVKMSKDTRGNDNINETTATFDHIVPRSAPHFGSEKESNITLACYKCNSSRGNQLSPPVFNEKKLTVRPVNDAGESFINLYFPVLDYGFIALKDYMGTDDCVEQAARTSYGVGTKKKSDTGGLIRYLLRHLHTSPFEMGGELKFHVGLPIFVARQWIRHRTGCFNEYSGRYSEMPMMFYTPEKFAVQSTTNKQGREGGEIADSHKWIQRLKGIRAQTIEVYKDMLDAGVSREMARIDLPLSTYTFWYWKVDLKNLLHFVGLRSEAHAQYEIRVYSDVIGGMLQQMYPHTFNAWLDYNFLATSFSPSQFELLKKIAAENYNDNQIDHLLEASGMGKGEIVEFKKKLTKKERPKFGLDLSLAKTPEYFERLIQEHS